MITYFFPPRPGVASLRLRGLAKYLPEFGWDPVILTAKLPEAPEPQYHVIETSYPGDATARWKARLGFKADKGFQEQIRIPRALREGKSLFISRVIRLAVEAIAYPDEQKGWYSFAFRSGTQLLEKEHFDIILSSSAPVTCHIIARALKMRYGVPWVADLRDLWTQNHYYSYTLARRLLERRLEVKTLSSADVLVTVSEPLAKKLRLLHRGKHVVAIPNGYDPDEVASALPTEEFTVTYTGQLYRGKRDPTPLLRVIAELISEGRLDRRVVKVSFYGTTEYWLEKEIKRFDLEDVVSLHPQVPRNIALEKQRKSQVLLLLNWNDPGEIGVYTGKVFEYLAAQRPILVVGGPSGIVTELLEETSAGVHVSREEDLKQVLSQLYETYKAYGCVPYAGREEYIARYSHLTMAQKFAELFDSLMKTKKTYQNL